MQIIANITEVSIDYFKIIYLMAIHKIPDKTKRRMGVILLSTNISRFHTTELQTVVGFTLLDANSTVV